MFKKILIANRGEIALRIIRTCKEMGIKTVIPFSDADRYTTPVTCAEESFPLNGNEPKDTYLNIEKLMDIAKKSGADALHPGYGFLSENALLAQACKDNGIVFIGPSADILKRIGDKTLAKKLAQKAGVPVVVGVNRPIGSIERAKRIARILGYPIIIKAVMGGGGRGMRVVTEEDALERALRAASQEACTSFNDSKVYIERFIDNPRHVEVQILADQHGDIIHLYERDCTIQRRHQKLLEESPSPVLTRAKREKLGRMAVRVCKAMGYENAGTVEFLLDGQGNLYFIEINARVQVEHPVTEVVTGVDIIKEQIRIANGEKLTLHQKRVRVRGHAIECRINAEDTENGFVPSTGVISDVIIPGGHGIRVDTALKHKYEVSPYYDSLVAKVISWGRDRETAINKMLAALSEMKVSGVQTTIPFFRKLLLNKQFRKAQYTTKFLESFTEHQTSDNTHYEAAAILTALYLKKMQRERGVSADLSDSKDKDSVLSKWNLAGRSETIRLRRGW